MAGTRTTVDVDLEGLPLASPETAVSAADFVQKPMGQPRKRQASRRLALGVGSVIPGTPYRLLRWLGDGGMGAVFEAQHVDTERRVAVKVLHSQRNTLKWVVDGFRNEARASARIGSTNIVDIYDFKELDDGRLLIAMEFLDGPTLHEEISKESPPWPRLVAIVRQICKGLSAAHRAGIVHRDIKPENIILVRRDQREDFVKLLDFGVALFIRDGNSVRMSGTAQYMAPESTEGSSDPRADLYSVGCLLYTLITGAPPFEGDTPSDILQKQREEQPLPPSKQTNRSVPAGWDELVLRCLAKDPDERYQSMDELEAALCELQIAHGWATDWDDLPPPDVEQERRDRIAAGLESLAAPPPPVAPLWPRLVLVGLVAVAAVVAVLVWPRDDTSAIDEALLEHALAAQRAAARFYFVYPPRNDPKGATAYRELLALEDLDTEAAQERGAQLREEFATTLVRLGDRYWDFEGARPFAYEYYASALVFVEDEHARARTGLSPVGLERLRSRAASADFTEVELLATEPLVALAETDEQARLEKLEMLREHAQLPASVAASLDRVIEQSEPPREPIVAVALPEAPSSPRLDDVGSETGSTGADLDPTTGDPDPAPANDDASEPPPAPTSPTPPKPSSQPRRDPIAARALVEAARAAVATGNRSRAETLYNQALDADPRSLEALDGLADVAFQAGRYAQSVQLLRRAVKFGPRDSARWLALGDAYFKVLRFTDAREAYERARDLGSTAAPGRLTKLESKLGSSGSGG